MTLVTGSDDGRRIGPKVFADVPTQSELTEARAEIERAREDARKVRGQAASLLILCVLFVGALAASVAFGYFMSHRHDAALEQLDEQLKQANHDLDQSKTDLAALRDKYSRYDNLVTADSGVVTLRGQIQQKLAQPVYAGALATATRAEKEALPQDAWMEGQLQSLNQRLTLLRSLQQKVDEFHPAQGGAGCTDPRGC